MTMMEMFVVDGWCLFAVADHDPDDCGGDDDDDNIDNMDIDIDANM